MIAALMHSPPLLLLDEPLNGLDAKSGRILKELVNLHVGNGGSVVFSTHVMEVAETMCTRIGIVSSGRVVAEGTMEQLRRLSGRSDSSLEDLFLQLTDEEKFVEDAIGRLREDSKVGTG